MNFEDDFGRFWVVVLSFVDIWEFLDFLVSIGCFISESYDSVISLLASISAVVGLVFANFGIEISLLTFAS
jgi:hypothetical protein